MCSRDNKSGGQDVYAHWPPCLSHQLTHKDRPGLRHMYVSGRTHNDNRIHRACSIHTQLNTHQETFFLLALILLCKNANASSQRLIAMFSTIIRRIKTHLCSSKIKHTNILESKLIEVYLI